MTVKRNLASCCNHNTDNNPKSMKLRCTFSTEANRREGMSREGSRDSIFSIHDEEDDEALCPTNLWECQTTKMRHPKTRHVRFADTLVYHECPFKREDGVSSWYSAKDFDRFALQTAQHTQLIRYMESTTQDPFFWSKNLQRIHHAFGDSDNTTAGANKHSMLTLVSNRIVLDAQFVGMESRIAPSITQDFVQRRQNLLSQVYYWQQATTVDASAKTKLIRQASEAVSRVSVMYSHYIAKVNARNMR